MLNNPAYQRKLIEIHIVAQDMQIHGCPECERLTWHKREQYGGMTVLKCTECEKEKTE